MSICRDLAEEVYTDLHDVAARAAAIDYTALRLPELLDLQSRRETARCAAAAVDHRIIAALMAQSTPKALGAKNWTEVLRTRLRISSKEALRLLQHAALLGPRTSVTGEPLAPIYPEVAAAQAAGAINAEHVGACQMVCVSPVNGRIAGRDNRQGHGWGAG